MDKVDFKTVIDEANNLLADNVGTLAEEKGYRAGVVDMVATLLFPDVPLAVAVELAQTALGSERW